MIFFLSFENITELEKFSPFSFLMPSYERTRKNRRERERWLIFKGYCTADIFKGKKNITQQAAVQLQVKNLTARGVLIRAHYNDSCRNLHMSLQDGDFASLQSSVI